MEQGPGEKLALRGRSKFYRRVRRAGLVVLWLIGMMLMLGAACGLIFVAYGLPIWKTIVSIREVRRLIKSGKCQSFEGNPDLYGLGIRIATYLQVGFTSFLDAICSIPFIHVRRSHYHQYAAGFASVNIWFLFALVVALCTLFRRDRQTPPLDLYITIAMGNGIMASLLAGVVWAPVTYIHETTFTQIGRTVTALLWHICTTIYWWKLMPMSLATATPTSSCPPSGWIFVKLTLEAESPLQKVHKAFTILTWAMLGVTWVHVWYLTYHLVHYVMSILEPKWLKFEMASAVGEDSVTAGHPLYDNNLGEVPPSQHAQPRERLLSKFTILYKLLCSCPSGDLQILFGISKPRSAGLRERYFSDTLYPGSGRSRSRGSSSTPVSGDGSDSGSTPLLVRPARTFMPTSAFSILWLLWTILTIEFTLALNNVVGVNSLDSVGQVVPFVVSVGACLSIVLGMIGGSGAELDEVEDFGSQMPDDSETKLDASGSHVDVSGSQISPSEGVLQADV